MALYLVSYDITKYGKEEYPELYARLEELEAVRILYSEWVLTADVGQSTNIYQAILGCIREGDRLLVVEITKDVAFDALLISDDGFMTLRDSARG